MKTRYLSLVWLLLLGSFARATAPIDRQDLVRRHRPVLREVDTLSPFSVGNGEFAFTADVTGLQTFPEHYAQGIPLSTQSQWGWHCFANPRQYRLEDTLVEYETHGRSTVYASDARSDAGQWLRANPHRLGLARIGFELACDDGTIAKIDDVQGVEQTLDLWTATLHSRFAVDGKTVRVRTTCHPQLDLLAVQIQSPLIPQNRLKIVFHFAYGSGRFGKEPEEWGQPHAHSTTIVRQGEKRVELSRTLDASSYRVCVAHSLGEQ